MKNINNLEEILDKMWKRSFEDTLEEVFEKALPGGLFLEFGVSSGGSLRTMANMRPDIHWHGFDSFEGLPEAWNGHNIGAFAAAIPEMPDNVSLHKGWFEDTLPEFIRTPGFVSFVNIDSDLYSSCKTIFHYLKFVPGSLIRFDELTGYEDWRNGEYKALCEFLLDTGWDIEVLSRQDSERAIVRLIEV